MKRALVLSSILQRLKHSIFFLTHCFHQIVDFKMVNFTLRGFYLIKTNGGNHSSFTGSAMPDCGGIWSAGRGLPAPGLESYDLFILE